MGNSYGGNPIVLDTFSPAIDVGNTLFGDSNMRIKLNYIEWQEPTTVDHTAVVTDGGGSRDLFNETCIVAKQSVIKYKHGMWVDGIKIGDNGVSSGKIIIGLV